MEVDDVRFPTSKTLAGSDAVHKDPDYSCVYVTLHTDDPKTPRGYGLTFTLGRGNEVVKACVRALASHVVRVRVREKVSWVHLDGWHRR